MTTYIINPNELQAVALAASTEKTRYHLNGVCFEYYGETFGMIATDGHRLHAVNAETAKPVADSFIFGTAEIKKALQLAKACKKEYKDFAHKVRIAVDHSGDDFFVVVGVWEETENKIAIESARFSCKVLDANFPDWRRVIPAESEETAPYFAFNAAYMADFGTASSLLTSQKYGHVRLTASGAENPIRVDIRDCDGFLGVLMPVRW